MASNPQITKITEEIAKSIIHLVHDQGKHLSNTECYLNEDGLYYYYSEKNNKYIGLDYSFDNDGYVEEFDTLKDCKRWLLGESYESVIENPSIKPVISKDQFQSICKKPLNSIKEQMKNHIKKQTKEKER